MANTTNFNWETPDDTDLVKDGAAAIRTLGQAIDTSMQDLEGGTSGQILSKNSNTDMDFVWINNDQGDITEVQAGTGISVASGTGPIPVITNTVATEFDAKGDLVVGTGADTFDKLTVGANDTILVADSSTATGLKWAAPAAGGGMTLISTQTVSSSGATVSFTSIPSTYKHLMLVVEDYYISADSLLVRFNNDSGTDYSYSQVEQFASSIGGLSGSGTTSLDGNVFGYGVTSSSANQKGSGVMWMYDYNNTGTKFGTINSRFRRSQDTNDNRGNWVNFSYNDSAIISEINLVRTNGSATVNGTFKLYGVN
jgi:hypothetical protein